MATTTTEIERKYTVPAAFVLPDLTTLPGVAAVTGPEEVDLDAIYYDTDDLRLTADATTLRRREGGADAGWHLKRTTAVGRTETHEDLSTDVPDSLTGEVRAITGGAPLEPIARIRNHRRETTVRDSAGNPLAVLADDMVTADRILAPRQTTEWHELEVELVAGTPALLDAIESILRDVGVRPATSPFKLARALGASTVVLTYLRAQHAAVLSNAALVRRSDPDGVHDMRVAIRRARATLRTYRLVLDRDRSEPLRAELRWLAGLLGAVRDSQMLRAHLDRAVKKVPPELVLGPVRGRIDERLLADEARATVELLDAFGSDRYAGLLRALEDVIRYPGPNASDQQLRRRARSAVRRADRLLEEATLRPRTDDGDIAFHEARKAYKRARYAIEVIEPIVGRPAHQFAKRIGDLQDVLGAHQDSVVAAEVMRDFGVRAHLDGDNAFTYGILLAREAAAGDRALADLDRARQRAAKHRLRHAVFSDS